MSGEEDFEAIWNNLVTRPTTDHITENIQDIGIPESNELSADVMSMDYTDLFYTNEWFGSREDLLDWVRTVGQQNRMVITVQRSVGGGENKKGRLWLVCERSGEYRQFKGKPNMLKVDAVEEESGDKQKGEKRRTSSKKCGCPFSLRGLQVSIMGPWALEVVNATHNHALGAYLDGHAYPGRLTKQEDEFVKDMSKNKVRPKNIFAQLRNKFSTNTSTIRTVYNARAKHKLSERGGRSQMQYLLGKLEEFSYYYLYRRCEASGEVRDLFFAHPKSIDLLRAFPNVLLMDCTYKTNKYRMPLMEIVGVTSTEMTFCVGCAYISNEKEDNYEWACSTVRALMDNKCLPTVIITDRELALMNAVATVFPESTHLLCRWHINRNMLANCKKHIKEKERFDMCMSSWNMVMLAETEEKFNETLQMFQIEFEDYPKVVEYAIKSWIEPYADRFLAHNTDNIRHYGNTTTNRAESHHAALKRLLHTSMGDFETCWESFHTLMETTHVAIKASFETSLFKVEHKFRSATYMCLRGLVSSSALRLIHDAIGELGEGVLEAYRCNHILRTVYGLPCHHELSEYVSKRMPIPLELLDAYWRKLDFEPQTMVTSKQKDFDNKWLEMWIGATVEYSNADYPHREMIYRRYMEAGNPSNTSLTEPRVTSRTRGRPKYSKKEKSTKRDPSSFELPATDVDPLYGDDKIYYETGPSAPVPMFTTKARRPKEIPRRPKEKVVKPPRRLRILDFLEAFDAAIPRDYADYIHATENVAGDGHCGFRAVAAQMGFGTDGWGRVRADLLEELNAYRNLYEGVFLEYGRVEQVKDRLDCIELVAPEHKWFCLPEMGHLVATVYNLPFVVFSRQVHLTYLPLRTGWDEFARINCVTLVNDNHFVAVDLIDGCPLPPISAQWFEFRSLDANTWRTYVNDRVEAFTLHEIVRHSKAKPSGEHPSSECPSSEYHSTDFGFGSSWDSIVVESD